MTKYETHTFVRAQNFGKFSRQEKEKFLPEKVKRFQREIAKIAVTLTPKRTKIIVACKMSKIVDEITQNLRNKNLRAIRE
jgi:hypothetical protein